MGDDIGQSNISAYTSGLMGYWTPNIDRIASEGLRFTDYYAEQSCSAGRSSPARRRSGLSKVGVAGAAIVLQARDRPSPRPASFTMDQIVEKMRQNFDPAQSR